MQKLLAPAALVILYVFFSIFGKNFFGYEGFKQILQSSYYIGFMAFGVTFVIITGGIDLSIGTVMMCSAIIGGTAFTNWGWPVPLALVLGTDLRPVLRPVQRPDDRQGKAAPLHRHAGAR